MPVTGDIVLKQTSSSSHCALSPVTVTTSVSLHPPRSARHRPMLSLLVMLLSVPTPRRNPQPRPSYAHASLIASFFALFNDVSLAVDWHWNRWRRDDTVRHAALHVVPFLMCCTAMTCCCLHPESCEGLSTNTVRSLSCSSCIGAQLTPLMANV